MSRSKRSEKQIKDKRSKRFNYVGDKEVADKLEEWFVERAYDGFVFAASYTPGSYEDIVDHVVPELQKRGLYHKDYSGSTLRENVGVPVPPVRNWNRLD